MRLLIILALLIPLCAAAAKAEEIAPRDGWKIMPTALSYSELFESLKASIAQQNMGLVTRASASDGARMQGHAIPGNMVVGVYRNDYARRMLQASVAAGIEAPIRFYLTENPDGTASLSYKTPSFVFAPYMSEGGEDLKALASELDGVFLKIAEGAIAK